MSRQPGHAMHHSHSAQTENCRKSKSVSELDGNQRYVVYTAASNRNNLGV